MDFSKYDPLKKKDPEKGFTSADHDDHSSASGRTEAWMTSTPVILLIEYLRKHLDQGVTLYERLGHIGLKFEPGLKGADIKNGRAQIAMNLFTLLQDATDDMKAMIAEGIEIPMLKRYAVPCPIPKQKAAEAAGPSQR